MKQMGRHRCCRGYELGLPASNTLCTLLIAKKCEVQGFCCRICGEAVSHLASEVVGIKAGCMAAEDTGAVRAS